MGKQRKKSNPVEFDNEVRCTLCEGAPASLDKPFAANLPVVNGKGEDMEMAGKPMKVLVCTRCLAAMAALFRPVELIAAPPKQELIQ